MSNKDAMSQEAEKFYSAAEGLAEQLDKTYQDMAELDEKFQLSQYRVSYLEKSNERLRLLTVLGACIAFFFGFGVCWLAFVH